MSAFPFEPSAASPFEPPAGEALSLLASPHPGAGKRGDVRAEAFEFSCRGDRVPLEILSPGTAATGPVLLVQPAPDDETPLADRAGLRAWLDAGVAVARVTPPLFGSRRSPKMTEMLEEAVAAASAGRAVDPNARMLWQEFTRQAVLELRRAVDALAEVRGAEPAVAFAGAGLGASVGAIFCANDPRPIGALLAAPGRYDVEGVGPSAALDAIAPRPLQVLEDANADLLEAAWSFLGTKLAGG